MDLSFWRRHICFNNNVIKIIYFVNEIKEASLNLFIYLILEFRNPFKYAGEMGEGLDGCGCVWRWLSLLLGYRRLVTLVDWWGCGWLKCGVHGCFFGRVIYSWKSALTNSKLWIAESLDSCKYGHREFKMYVLGTSFSQEVSLNGRVFDSKLRLSQQCCRKFKYSGNLRYIDG